MCIKHPSFSVATILHSPANYIENFLQWSFFHRQQLSTAMGAKSRFSCSKKRKKKLSPNEISTLILALGTHWLTHSSLSQFTSVSATWSAMMISESKSCSCKHTALEFEWKASQLMFPQRWSKDLMKWSAWCAVISMFELRSKEARGIFVDHYLARAILTWDKPESARVSTLANFRAKYTGNCGDHWCHLGTSSKQKQRFFSITCWTLSITDFFFF